MVIAGINFLRLYRFFVQRRVDVLAKDEELRLYLALIVIGTTLIAIEVIGGGYETRRGGRPPQPLPGHRDPDHDRLRDRRLRALGPAGDGHAAAADVLRRHRAGSTGGGIKIVRHLLLFKLVQRELEQTVHREVDRPDPRQPPRRRREGAALARSSSSCSTC